QRRGVHRFELQRVQQPEGAYQVHQSVSASELVQVQVGHREAVNGRLGPGEAADGVQRPGADGLGKGGAGDHPLQLGHVATGTLGPFDQHAYPTEVTPLLAARGDADLLVEAEGLDGGLQEGAVGSDVEEGAQRHVARDSRRAVEVGDSAHLLRVTSAPKAWNSPSTGGRFRTRTVARSTWSNASIRVAIRSATDSRRVRGSPSTTSRTTS